MPWSPPRWCRSGAAAGERPVFDAGVGARAANLSRRCGGGGWKPLRCGVIAFSEYVTRRKAYSYPAVGLSGCLSCWNEVSFHSTQQLDGDQYQLLLSDENDQVVLGYLSTIFWGYFSGKNKATHPERAQGKVRLALNGKDRNRNGRIRGVKDRGIDFVALEIRAAFASLKSDQYAESLRRLCDLPQLKLAFASKVCGFLAPTRCGVIDSVMAHNYPCFRFSVDDNDIVKNTSANRTNYAGYCSFLQEQAGTLNSQGQQFWWMDRDGICHAWRAVDVERALY